jgi:hypothetical protein
VEARAAPRSYAEAKLFKPFKPELRKLAEPDGYVECLMSRLSVLTVLIEGAKVGFRPVRSCCLAGGAIAE